jgi:long-chain acyl-CoA synthetase
MTHSENVSQTINAAFRKAAALHPDKVALMSKNETDEYVVITYHELNETLDRVAASLAKLGIGKGDRVAIYSGNRPEWAISDLAVLRLGAIVVPIYQTLPASAVAHIVNDSGSKLIFVENAKLFSVIDGIRSQIPCLSHIVVFDPAGLGAQENRLSFSDLQGDTDNPITNSFFENLTPIAKDDPATIVYTSGTTGEPKGAVLSHWNIVSNAFSAMGRFRFSSEDVILSYLPLCHMFERTCGNYTFLFAGGRIAYAKDMTTIVEDIQKIQPTILIAVPRIIEKVHEAVENRVLESSFVRRKLVFAAIQALNQYANLTYKGLKIPLLLRIKRSFYDALIASKFRKIAGNNLRLLVSGGAPLSSRTAKTLYILGFNILEGYGLTETSPVVCTNSVKDNRLGTVGKPLDDVEVKIGENDEILVRGPNVMMGYFNKPEETAGAIDKEGWFHTGDQGRFDEDGNLTITGRIKELIITSYGKNVPPVPIEEEITRSAYIEQAVLCGEGRKYISALIVPRRETVEHWAGERNVQTASYEELLKEEEIRALIGGEIEKFTSEVPSYARVKAFTLLPESFTVDNQLLTPTLKLRRRKIFERYRDEFDSMYQMGGPQPGGGP